MKSGDKTDQKGQALIELIVFIPLILTIYSVIGGFASSINGSINQQKITRSYFYYRIQNNPYMPGPKVAQPDWKLFGMFYIGWRSKFASGGTEEPVMPCYKISIPFKDKPQDECEEPYTQDTTLYLRVGTVYGICGQTYYRTSETAVYSVPDHIDTNFQILLAPEGCTIAQ